MNVIRDVDGKTIVQVKVPVCLTLQLNESDAHGMTRDDLCGLIDEAIDAIAAVACVQDLPPRKHMQRLPVRFAVARHWDELPVEELEIMSQDEGFFDE